MARQACRRRHAARPAASTRSHDFKKVFERRRVIVLDPSRGSAKMRAVGGIVAGGFMLADCFWADVTSACAAERQRDKRGEQEFEARELAGVGKRHFPKSQTLTACPALAANLQACVAINFQFGLREATSRANVQISVTSLIRLGSPPITSRPGRGWRKSTRSRISPSIARRRP
mgnify:CR=1 FL=1